MGGEIETWHIFTYRYFPVFFLEKRKVFYVATFLTIVANYQISLTMHGEKTTENERERN